MTTGHARVLTALFAAVTLHALLLGWPLPASTDMSFSNGLLHVDLLEPSMPTANQPVPESRPVTAHKQTEPQKSRSAQTEKAPLKQQTPHMRAPSTVQHSEPASAPVIAVVTKPVVIKTANRAFQNTRESSQAPHAANAANTDPALARSPHRQDKTMLSAAQHLPALMAAAVQSMLLASIHYPSQARRHGWQGAGEFRLDISNRSIRNVTMLVSTGHAILDRAAERGLTRVASVPVADGQYRLPVAFRLQ